MSPHRAAAALPSRAALIPALLLGLGLLAAGAAGQAFGQAGFSRDVEVPTALASLDARLEPATARRGEHVRLLVTAQVSPGWHIYSLVPQGGEFGPPPTVLTVEARGLEAVAPPYETNPVIQRDRVFDQDLAYHEKAARFYQNLQVPAGFALGQTTVQAELRYQVCNDKFCTPPRTERLTAGLTVEGGPVRPPYAFMLRTIDYLDGNGTFWADPESLESALARGIGSFLLLAAGFGLLALLTPCVFPMLPVTVSFFTASGRRGMAALRLALLFAAGIVVTSTGIGLALTALLGAGGVTRFASSPWLNLVVAAFFVLFALSLMDLLRVPLPSALVQRLDGASRHTKGPLGVLLMGVAFTATSFTCTMPFVGTLLLAATQGQFFWPLVGMLVFSGVFSLPFFLLALFPQWLLRLRGASGNWLVQVKVVLGLVEVMAALKFLGNADVVWRWGVFDRGVVLALWAALAAATALVLLGLLPWPGVRVRGSHPLRLGVAAGFLALAVYLGLGAGGRELDAYTEAYLPPPVEASTARAAVGDLLPGDAVAQLPWRSSLAEGLREAQRAGKPVFIDFTGYTCVNCRWMEKRIFAERSVYEVLRDRFVLVRLYTDGGPDGEANQNLEIQRFGTVALPYYVILAPDNTALAKHAGIVPTAPEFLKFLSQGWYPERCCIRAKTG